MVTEREKRREEQKKLVQIVNFIKEGEITITPRSVDYPNQSTLRLERARPSYEVYDFGSGKPLATDRDYLDTTTEELKGALSFISRSYWEPSFPTRAPGIEIKDIVKLANNYGQIQTAIKDLA